jgi:fructokinase
MTGQPGPRADITVIGEAIIDLVPGAQPQTYHAAPGGSPYNVAVGLARLGLPPDTDTAAVVRCDHGVVSA